MNVAVIDIGTNTFHLLIAEVHADGTYNKLYSTKNSVKLGKGGITQNFIMNAPFKKGVETLEKYKGIARKYKTKHIIAFATSAVRSASNGRLFTAEVKKSTGIDIQVISGEQEADYIYHGVRQALDLGKEMNLVMDIGGGSVEFIIGNANECTWKSSYNIGVARLLEKIQPSDPITPQQITALEKYLEEQLKPLFAVVSQYGIHTLIGASGSFDTFAEMIAYRYNAPTHIHNKTAVDINLEHYTAIHQQLLKSTLAERRATKGIILMRVDMIVLSSILVNVVIRNLSINRMRLSTYALKEGALIRFIGNMEDTKK